MDMTRIEFVENAEYIKINSGWSLPRKHFLYGCTFSGVYLPKR